MPRAVVQLQDGRRAVVELGGGGQQPSPEPQDTSFRDLPGNIVPSAVRAGKDIATAVTNPIQTLTGVTSTLAGAAQAALPGKFQPRNDTQQQNQQAFENFSGFLKNRYGSVENAKKTVINDPVGFALDAASVLTGVGGALRGTAKVATRAGVKASSLARAGQKVSQAGRAIDPLIQSGKVVALPFRKAKQLANNASTRLYQSALKPSDKLAERGVVETGLREGVKVSPKGLTKTTKVIDDLNNQISNLIEESSKKNQKVNLNDITQALEPEREFFRNAIGGQQYLDEMNDLVKDFRSKFGENIDVAQAQKIKQNTNQLISKYYGQISGSTMQSQKMLVRGLKDQIAKRVEEIGDLNLRESELISLENAIEKAVKRTSNRSVLPLTSTIFASQGGGGILAALLSGTLMHPAVQSQIAILLRRAATKGVNVPTGAQVIPQLLFQLGRTSDRSESGSQSILPQQPQSDTPPQALPGLR